MDLNQIILPIIYILVVLVAILFVSAYFLGRGAKGRLIRALNMKLFLITLPREMPKTNEQQPQKSDKELIAVAEQFLSNLAELKPRSWWKSVYYGPPHITFEIAVPHTDEQIYFYAAVPRGFETFIEKQIHGFYPNASVEEIEDYNIFHPKSETSGGFLSLARKYILPFRTYQNLEADPLGSITNALSKIMGETVGGALQIVLRPAKKGWNKPGIKTAKTMAEGKTYEAALGAQSAVSQAREVFETPKKPGEAPLEKPKTLSPIDEETMKALKEKASKPGFEVNVRFLTSAENQERSEQLLSHIEGSFDQFNSPTLNSLKSSRTGKKRLKKLIYNFSFRLFDETEKVILNSEEVASIFHFPLPSLETPRVKWLKAKPAQPPANLPEEGLILGRNVYRGEERMVRIKQDDRSRHLYTIGQTGTGKSIFLQNMIKQDIENGEGVAFLDPHGDVVEKILEFVPKERAEDVIYFNPADIERPLALNMLEFDPKYPEQKTFVANEMINIFKKLWGAMPEAFGPMFEQYMRNALLLIMDDPESGSTLLEVPRVLVDEEFRHYKLSKTTNTVVKDFWLKEAEKAGGEAALANMAPYITSKANVFLANDIMRPIVCQQKSAFNFREVMDEKKILLVNLTKGKLGDVNSNLLGLIIVGKLLMASLSRVDVPEEKRTDFYLYMDEFQNFTTESISTILAEARKYKLCLTIAHQFIGQLEDKIKDSVFGNVGSMVCFRIGPEDAEFVVKQYEPVFSQQDLINIDNFNAYLKLLIGGQTTRPFNILTYPPEKGDPKAAEMAKEFSRLKYGREKAVVEKEILERSKVAEGKAEESLPPSEPT